MKRTVILLIALLVMSVVPLTVSCQDNFLIELKDGNPQPEWGPDGYYYIFAPENLPGPFEAYQEEFKVDFIIPMGLEILGAQMTLEVPEEWNIADLTVTLGTETIYSAEDEPTKYEFTEELKDSVENSETTLQKEYKIQFPLVFKSRQEGTIEIREFSVDYRISAVEEVRIITDPEDPETKIPLLDPKTGIPLYFSWEPSTGPTPRYLLQIREIDDFSENPFESLNILFPESETTTDLEDTSEFELTGTFYDLTEDIETLKGKLEFGKTYFWGVRVVFDYGKSQWKTGEFTRRPHPVSDISMDENENQFIFTWNDPGFIRCYQIELNDHLLELDWEISDQVEISYPIEKTNEYLERGENTLTIWTISHQVESEPVSELFEFEMNPPNVLYPISEYINKKEFDYEWEEAFGAVEYEIQLVEKNLEKEIVKTATIRGADNNTCSSSLEDLELTPGKFYIWSVNAVRFDSNGKPKTTTGTTGMFFYNPVNLWMLTLFSAIGGLLGGFIRIAKEERDKASKKKQRLRIHSDSQTCIGLIVGVIIGVIFYLIVNETLSSQLNLLNISPHSYPGSLILGFIGGLISYEITRLKHVLPE